MKLIDCSEEQLLEFKQKYNLKLGWEMVGNLQKVEISNETVGLIDFSHGGMYGENSIEIESFEVFEKGNGIGSEIINEFLKKYNGKIIWLYGYDQNSSAFWMKHNFKAENDGTNFTEILVYR